MEKLEFKGELRHIEPYRLLKEDEVDKTANFFLVLAVVFNDLKGITLFEKLVFENYKPASIDDTSSVHIGEYGGIFTQTRKLYISCLREFLDFLKENEEILTTSEFQDILKGTNKDIENKWNNIVNIALNKSKDTSDFTSYLIKVRNNVAFHYNQSGKELKKAFCSYFYKKEKIDHNEFAYYAIGENIETTRFFYADAAVQEYLRSTTNEKTEGFDIKYRKEISIIINDINWTILRLLKAYLKSRPK